jgi:putative hemolysin
VDVDPLPYLMLVLFLGLVVFAAAAEMAFAAVNRQSIRAKAEGGDRGAQRVETALSDSTQLLITTMLLKTIGLIGVGSSLIWLMPPSLLPITQVAVFFLAWIALSVIQVLSRAYVQRHAEQVALWLAPILNGSTALLWPLSTLLQRLGIQVSDGDGEVSEESVFLTEDGLRLLINVREEEDSIEEAERQMIANILEMEETVVREIMVPRIDMVALEVNTSLQDALDVIIEAGHSRIPVYEENIDKLVGFLYAKDLLHCFRHNQSARPIGELLRDAYYVPVTKSLDTLFAEMQKRRVHIAVVVDEYGGTAGLITIEDILEEIVGEIQDEYDEEEEIYVQPIDANTYEINARLDIDSLAELLDTTLPDEDADTLGGLIYSLLGHVPELGEMVDCGGWHFTVLALDGRRIELVRAQRVQDEETERKGENDVTDPQISGSSSLINPLAVD